MPYGPPKKPKPEHRPGRRGLGSAPYDHVDPDLKDPTSDDDGEPEYDFYDPDEGSRHITPERTRALTDQVKLGVPVTVAASALGIEKDLWNHWCRMGREHKAKKMKGGFGPGESTYVYFVNEVNKAKAQAESSAIMAWHGAFDKDWKAVLAWLERTGSVRWHLATKVEIEGKMSGDKMDMSKLPTATVLKFAKGQVEDAEEPKALPADIEDAEVLDEGGGDGSE